jgi:hypothetical protein
MLNSISKKSGMALCSSLSGSNSPDKVGKPKMGGNNIMFKASGLAIVVIKNAVIKYLRLI